MTRAIPRSALAFALALVVLGATGAAATSERVATDLLTGCRNTSTGTIDQVKAGRLPMGGACSAGEVKLAWNKVGPAGPQGDPGAQGEPGTPGLPGVPGQDGVSGWVLVQNDNATMSIPDTDASKQLVVYCPAGKVPVGGGYDTYSTYGDFRPHTAIDSPHSHVEGSTPVFDGWWARVFDDSGTFHPWSMWVYVICVTALP